MSREDREVSEEYQLILRGVSEKKSTIGKSVTLKVTERWRFVGEPYRTVRAATNLDLYRPEIGSSFERIFHTEDSYWSNRRRKIWLVVSRNLKLWPIAFGEYTPIHTPVQCLRPLVIVKKEKAKESPVFIVIRNSVSAEIETSRNLSWTNVHS